MTDEKSLASSDQLKDLLSGTMGRASSPLDALTVYRSGKEDYFKVGDDRKVDSVIGILLYSQRPIRTWWSSSEITNSPPVCWSADGVKPYEGVEEPQSEQCAGCPHDKFGTAAQGKGKACKTRAADFIMELMLDTTAIRPPTGKSIEVVTVKTDDIVGPALVRYAISNKLSPASWQALQRFAREHDTFPQGLVVRWRFESTMSKNNVKFDAVVVEPIAKLSPQTIEEHVIPMVRSLKAGGAQQVIEMLAGSPGE